MTRGNRLGTALRPGLAGGCRLAVFLAVAACADEAATNATGRAQFRLAFSSATFTDVNENDAKAGIKVWARTLLRERGLPVDPEPVILSGPQAITEALRDGRVDAVTLNTDEYWELDSGLVSGPFIAGLNDGQITEEYVLLVHHESRIKELADLHGRHLTFFQNTRMSLALVWLDVVLAKGGFPRARESCRITTQNKLTKVVLPVFFHQADACVVTRRGFKIMSELNPQVGQHLKALATSPELVPTGFCFRRDYQDPLKNTIVAELAKIGDSPAGTQVLTLFQSGSLEAHPLSCLDSALDLLETHRRLYGKTNAAASAAPAVAEGGAK